MGLFDHWPYTNFHELNLTWLLRRMEDLSNVVENFVSLNTIKYADPIQWNITTQYETNTVVVDPNTGKAYLSVKPVPLGVALTNTDYWTPIFDLNVLTQNQNITFRDDASNVLSTFASSVGDWLIWNNTLYKVSQNIAIGQAYVVGYNIDRYSVELFISDYIAALETKIGDLANLNTTDKSSIVNAINELVTAVGNIKDLTYVNVKDYGAVGDGVTDDTAAIDAAITVAGNNNSIYFPSGQYLTSGHVLNTSTGILGAGPQSIIISTDNSKPVFKYTVSDLQLLQIKNLYITRSTAADASDTNAFGVQFDSTTSGMSLKIDNVIFYNHYISFKSDGNVTGATIKDCWSINSIAAGFTFASIWYVYNCFSYDTAIAFLVDGSFRTIAGFYFDGCTAYRTTSAGFMVDGSNNAIYDVMIRGCIAGSNRTGAFVFYGTGGNHTIDSCYSEYSGYSSEAKTDPNAIINASAIYVEQHNGVIVSDFYQFESAYSALGLNGASNVKMQDSIAKGNKYGIYTQNGCNNVRVDNVNADGLSMGTVGIVVDDGLLTNTKLAFENVDISNYSQAIYTTSTDEISMKNVSGYTPTITTPTLVSGQTFTNNTPFDIQVIVTGAPTTISIDSLYAPPMPTSAGMTFILQKGHHCAITYTNATYWTWIPIF